MINFFENIFGHQNEIQLLQDLKKSITPKSLIFSGVKGIGKCLLARKYSEFYLSSVSKRLYGNFLNNIFLLNSSEFEKLNMEGVRDTIKEMSLSSINDLQKFFIIDEFDSLNINSKNALLKKLEEPSDNINIILISHKYESLLRTVKSRCLNINFNRLDSNEFQKFLDANEPSADSLRKTQLVNLCQGRPGLYKIINKLNWLEIKDQISEVVKKEKIDYEMIDELFLSYKKDTINFEFLIKKQLYDLSKIELLKNKDNIKVSKQIINFLNFASKSINTNLNINQKNYFISIFINYFRFVK